MKHVKLSQYQHNALEIVLSLVKLLGVPDYKEGEKLRDFATRSTEYYLENGFGAGASMGRDSYSELFCANWSADLKLLMECCLTEPPEDQTLKVEIMKKSITQMLDELRAKNEALVKLQRKHTFLYVYTRSVAFSTDRTMDAYREYAKQTLKQVDAI